MRESSKIDKRLLSPNYKRLTIWLIMMLMQAGLLMYDNITQFESDVSHLTPETPWFILFLGIAGCCEIIGLFILFAKKRWGFSIVALSELSSIIFTFFSPLSPSVFNIIFSLVKLAVLNFFLSMEDRTVFSYRKPTKKSTMSFSLFVGIIVCICLIIATIIAESTPKSHNAPNTIPIWQYTPTPLQYTPIPVIPLPHNIPPIP